MGSDKQEKTQRRPYQPPRQPSPKPETMFVSFYPTQVEQKAIRDNTASLSVITAALGARMERGLDVKITRNASDTAFCAAIREKQLAYGEGQVLACFHSDIETLLRIAHYALTIRFPEYPDQPLKVSQMEFDW